MNAHFSTSIALVPSLRAGLIVAGLLLSLLGCSRSAVVIVPESNSRSDETASQKPPAHTRTQESVAKKPLARAKVEQQENKKPLARAQADETTSKNPQARAQEKPKVVPFRFPEDAGGVLLAKILPPQDAPTTRLEQRRPTPRRSSVSSFAAPAVLPLPTSHAAMPRLPQEARRTSLRPSLVLEETLGSPSDTPVLPQVSALPERDRVRVPSIDANEPIPLPILATPLSERASLDDPTSDVSNAAAIAAPIPPRMSKAPFLKLTLPDPYDHRRGDVPTPEESKEFPLGSPQLPQR
jgi:hypothetical protein